MLLKPQTYMNDSGRSVGEAQRFLKIAEGDIYVFHDELDLAPGKVQGEDRRRQRRPQRPALDHARTSATTTRRVRIGIGHPGSKELVLRLRAARLRQGRRGLARAAARRHRRRGAAACRRRRRALPDRRGARAEGRRGGAARPRRSAAPRRARRSRAAGAARHPAGERQGKRASALAENLKRWLKGRSREELIHGLQMRHRRPAERRQVHPLQRADADGGGAGGQLSVLHHRAQRRRRRRARPAARQAGRRSASRPQIIPTRLTFVDIAGLVRGASKGEGLGNQFLANIREVDAVAYVLRCFEDDDVTHVEGRIDPLADAETVETELMLADLDSLERRREPLAQEGARPATRKPRRSSPLIDKALELVRAGKPARLAKLTRGGGAGYRALQLLTAKPVLYVCNVDEASAAAGNAMSQAGRGNAPARKAPAASSSRPRSRPSSPAWRRRSATSSWTTWAWRSRASTG